MAMFAVIDAAPLLALQIDEITDSFDEAFGQLNASPIEADSSGNRDLPEIMPSRTVPLAEVEPAVRSKVSAEAYRLVIKTPITNSERLRVKFQLEKIASNASGQQPRVLVMFEPQQEPSGMNVKTAIGEASDFEACLGIARLLTGPTGGKLNSTAFVNPSLSGHAVLVAMACQNIVMQPQAEIGNASGPDEAVDETMRQSYLQIGRQRAHFPEAVVRSMLDAQSEVYRVVMLDKSTRFASKDELELIRTSGQLLEQDRVTIPGQKGMFNGQQSRQFQWIDGLADSVDALMQFYEIERLSDVSSVLALENPIATMFEIDGPITNSLVNRCIRALRESRRSGQMNLCIVTLNSSGGDLDQSNRLAGFLLDLRNNGVQTVAIIDRQAVGDAALIAMACDQVFAVAGSRFGGVGAVSIPVEEIYQYSALWSKLAERSGKNAACFYGVISDEIPLNEFRNPNGGIQLANQRLLRQDNKAQGWNLIAETPEINQIDLNEALKRGWIAGEVRSRDSVAEQVGLNALPPPKRVSNFEQWLSNLAANRMIAIVLLTIGLATFTTELTAPGTIFFGFISLVAFSGFFWLQFLNGTVESLEIVLFFSGLLAIVLEILVVPGFGVFGIGGMVLCLSSLVLASQRFVIPVTTIQWNQLAWNVLSVSAAAFSSLLVLFFLSARIQRSPLFKLLELKPPTVVAAGEVPSSPLQDLIGKSGRAITACNPFGRAVVDGTTHNVKSIGGFIDPDATVVVKKVDDRTLIVEASKLP